MKKILLAIVITCATLFSCTKSEEEVSNGLNYDKLIVGKWRVDDYLLELTFNGDNTFHYYYADDYSNIIDKTGSWFIYGRHIDIAFDNYYSGVGGGYTGSIRELNNDNFEMVVTNTSSGNSDQWNGRRIN